MTKDDPKKIKEELRPLKDLLEIVKDKVDRMEAFQNVTMQQVRDIKSQQSVMNGKLDDIGERLDGIESRLDDPDTGLSAINRRLDVNIGAIVKLEQTVNGYADMYKINDSNIRKMQKRLEIAEEDAGVDVPPELHSEDFSKSP